MYRSPVFGHYAGSIMPMCWCLPRVYVEDFGLVVAHRRVVPGGL